MEMRTNGYHLRQLPMANPKARPLKVQLDCVVRHRDKCIRKLDRLLGCQHNGGNNKVGTRTVEVERQILRLQEIITQNNFTIENLKMKTLNPSFNRQAVVREKKTHDRGTVLWSKPKVINDHRDKKPN